MSKPLPTTCRHCGAGLSRKTPKKKQQGKRTYFYEWILVCSSPVCDFMHLPAEARRNFDAAPDLFSNRPASAPDIIRCEDDWRHTHYRWRGPTGIIEWIPRDVHLGPSYGPVKQ